MQTVLLWFTCNARATQLAAHPAQGTQLYLLNIGITIDIENQMLHDASLRLFVLIRVVVTYSWLLTLIVSELC